VTAVRTPGCGTVRLSPPDCLPPYSAGPGQYAVAVECYLTATGISANSARIYRISLINWSWLLAGRPTPLGRFRRGAEPPALALAVLDDPSLPARLAECAAARADAVDSDTVQREMSILRKAIRWWRSQGWIDADPTEGIEHRPVFPTDQARPLTSHQTARLWRLEAALRERTLWRLVHETPMPPEGVLALNVEDVLPADDDRVRWRLHWQPGTVRSLARLIGVRRSGPLFLSALASPWPVPTRDRCPITGWPRLPYRHAEDIFENATRLLANPLADARQAEELRGWSLHRLGRSGAGTGMGTGPLAGPGAFQRSRSTVWSGAEGNSRERGDCIRLSDRPSS
jgi:integrase/recombinase XerD